MTTSTAIDVRPAPARRSPCPDARMAHLYVARGALDFQGVGRLEAGDAVRLSPAGAPLVTAGAHGAEALVRELGA
jgi:quercetin 2,3-dioxygenase